MKGFWGGNILERVFWQKEMLSVIRDEDALAADKTLAAVEGDGLASFGSQGLKDFWCAIAMPGEVEGLLPSAGIMIVDLEPGWSGYRIELRPSSMNS